MVMHARKPQRINDGYFEKHQTHPYQNSKYGGSKSSYSSDRSYGHDRMRDSPNGNYRSDSPDSQSPRDRNYQNKSSYLQKIRDKERDSRDYKSRDKYSDCARSPKDKRSRESRDSEYRSNHDRSNAEEKRDERDRAPRVGDWSEHISSSGKKYYYNCKTEVSQWEKPRDWMERRGGGSSSSSSLKERDMDSRNYSSSSRGSIHDKHSNSRSMASSGRDQKSSSGRQGDRENYWHTSQQGGSTRDDDLHDRRKHMDETQDMDISPGDSTPTSETCYTRTPVAPSVSEHHQHHHHHSSSTSSSSAAVAGSSGAGSSSSMLHASPLPRLVSHPLPNSASCGAGSSSSNQPGSSNMSTPQRQTCFQSCKPPSSMTPSIIPTQQQQQQQQQASPSSSSAPTSSGSSMSLAASLPRLLSQITGSKGLDQSELSPQKALQTIQTALMLSRQVSLEPGGSGERNYDTNGATTSSSAGNHQGQSSQMQPLKVDTSNNPTIGEGPPTPTHSESQDYVDARKVSSPPSSLSSLQSLAGGSSLHALRPQGPNLTPSLANFYRDDLVNHVRGMPADLLEKQAQKLSDEAYILGSLQCTKVSAELKTARSIVRLTEIQATLQEQRILFLRQQIKQLEELKSQNSFMSDS